MKRGFGISVAVLAAILAAAWLGRPSAPPPTPARPATPAPAPASPPTPPPVAAAPAWVLWYGEDARIYRRPSSPAYQELYHALHQSIETDRQPLEALLRDYVSQALEPSLAALPPRLEPYLAGELGLGASAGRLGKALEVAATLEIETLDEEARPEALRHKLAAVLAGDFLRVVWEADAHPRALRAGAERALGLAREDLLQNCERYDRAFRWFVLYTPGTVEILEGERDWTPDPFWQPANATFLPLCLGLRQARAGAGPAVEAVLTASRTLLETRVRELFQRIPALLPVEAALAIGETRNRHAAALEGLGLAAHWSRPPARLSAYLTSPWTLGQALWAGLDDRATREALPAGLNAAMEETGERLRQDLYELGREFVEAELERMHLGLAARSEGPWSTTP